MEPTNGKNGSVPKRDGTGLTGSKGLVVAIFGPPGSGKGTQAGWLCEKYGLEHISTGDLLRAERKAGTPLGMKADALISRGELVPDEWVGEIVRRKLGESLETGRGALLDGYPRTLSQLDRLREILTDLGIELKVALFLNIDDRALIDRLTGRRLCENCQRTYHIRSRPPKTPGVCDACGGKLIQRADDCEEVITTRLGEYHRKTRPILAAIEAEGRLRSVRADQPIDSVQGRLSEVLAEESGVPAR